MAKTRGIISHMQDVLSQANHADLESFFVRYLRHDVKAQLQFLARFSDKIDLDEAQKYEWLFYKSVQLLRGSSTHLGISKQKSLLRIYEELHGQAADALAINHYVKTFYILSYGLSFMRLLSKKENSMHKGFQDCYNEYMELLFHLYEADLPRDLVHRILPFIEQEMKLASNAFDESFYSYQRLKIRLEYYYNGIDALITYIDREWGNKALKSAEHLADFYHTLFTESWIESNLDELSSLEIPRDIWKKVLNRLKRQENFSLINQLWKSFHLKKTFEDSKYKTFVKSIRPKKSKKSTRKTLKLTE